MKKTYERPALVKAGELPKLTVVTVTAMAMAMETGTAANIVAT